MLYYKGNIIWNNFCLAIIGSRDCSQESKDEVLKIVASLPKDIIIISGLARGIDTCAHYSALINKKKTIAVLPCGIETIYPKENKGLSEEILKTGGMLLSEYPNKERATGKTFFLRNRIITGLSSAVLVAHAKIKSGTMNAVGFAKKQEKPIYAIPGSEGTDFLLSNGAQLASNLPLLFKNDNNES